MIAITEGIEIEEKESYEDITAEEISACRHCKLDICDETDPECEYRKLKAGMHLLDRQKSWYDKKKEDPEWCKAEKERLRKKYKKNSQDPLWVEKIRQRQRKYYREKTGQVKVAK